MARDRGSRLVYHFTHLTNLPAILTEGALLAGSAVGDGRLVTEVGDREIKESRRRRQVPIQPGGSAADYVPFYFAPRSPMLFRIACDHRDRLPGRYQGGDDALVYLVSSLERIVADGLSWVGTDGNAAALVTRFTADLEELEQLVDWQLMEERIWKNTPTDPDRVRRRMAEVLVHRRVPLSTVLGIAVRTAEQERRVRAILAAHGSADRYVAVRPDWYYCDQVGKGVAR